MDVVQTELFEEWFAKCSISQKKKITEQLFLLVDRGPSLGRPHVDSIHGSRIHNLKELRVNCQGRHLRILFVFNRNQDVMLLCGGDKTGKKRFYERMIATAEKLYEEYDGE